MNKLTKITPEKVVYKGMYVLNDTTCIFCQKRAL